MGAGELAAEKFDEAAGARASVGAEQAHAIEEDEKLENFGVFGATLGSLRRGLFGFVQESGEGVVETALDGQDRRLVVDDARGKRLVGFGLRLESGKDVWVSGGGLRGAEFGDCEGDGGDKLRVDADEIGSEAYVEQRSIGWEFAGMLFFVAVGGKEIGAVWRAVEGDLAFRAAADGADRFSLGRAEAARFAFLTDRTGQEEPPKSSVKPNCKL
jgi:hypothetical protein